MPRKKKAAAKAVEVAEVAAVPSAAPAPEAAGPHDIVGPEIREGFMHLSRIDLLEFELRQSRVLALQTRRNLLRYEVAEVRKQQERDMQNTDAAFRAATEDYLSYKKQLGAAYSVDFAVATYDDSTGRLLIEGAPILASTD